MENQAENRSYVRYAPVAVVVAGVLAVSAACSANVNRSNETTVPPTVISSQPQAQLQPTLPAIESQSSSAALPPPSTELPTTATVTPRETDKTCEAPYVPAFPGSRYKQSNADDIQKQLNALGVAHSPQEKVTFRDVANAEIISLNALADPAYAEAFTYANQQAASMPTAQQLLDKGFTGPDCITGKQLTQVSDLYDTLLTGLAPKAGRQMSGSAKAAWQALKDAKDAFVQKYQQQMSQ
jgi:hypothetical protein